jgi:hypothetical protein
VAVGDGCHHRPTMLDRLPRRLRFAFSKPEGTPVPEVEGARGRDEVEIMAYGEDCVLSGRLILDGDQLTEMFNDHEEYTLTDVTVERFDGGLPIEIDDVLVGRDELLLVHSSGPLGVAGLRWATAPRYVAVKTGPYRVRGFFHGPPGADPVDAIRRQKPMVPLTDVRVEYLLYGEPREIRVATVIMNRHQVDWIQPIEVDREAFPPAPARSAPIPTPGSPGPTPVAPTPSPMAGAPQPAPPAAGTKRPAAASKRPATGTKRAATGTKRPPARRQKPATTDPS